MTRKKKESEKIVEEVIAENVVLESLGLQGDPTSQSISKSVLNIHWKD